MRRNHNLSTHVAFVDLVKAFDTANYDLLIDIIKKYGAPPALRSVVKRLYTDLKVVLKIGKCVKEIVQEVGVRQRDNMAPVLFLFLMNAFADSLEKIWEDKGLQKVQVQHASDKDFEDGKNTMITTPLLTHAFLVGNTIALLFREVDVDVSAESLYVLYPHP